MPSRAPKTYVLRTKHYPAREQDSPEQQEIRRLRRTVEGLRKSNRRYRTLVTELKEHMDVVFRRHTYPVPRKETV